MNGYGVPFADQSRVFLDQAWIELEADDLQQASEKGWGATSQIVKAYASERGLDHNSHGRLFAAVGSLVAETDDDSYRTLFQAGGGLHANFYEGGYTPREIRGNLEQISEFVDKVGALLNGANGASDPSTSSG